MPVWIETSYCQWGFCVDGWGSTDGREKQVTKTVAFLDLFFLCVLSNCNSIMHMYVFVMFHSMIKHCFHCFFLRYVQTLRWFYKKIKTMKHEFVCIPHSLNLMVRWILHKFLRHVSLSRVHFGIFTFVLRPMKQKELHQWYS